MRMLQGARAFDMTIRLAMVFSSRALGKPGPLNSRSPVHQIDWTGLEKFLPEFGSAGSNDPTSDLDINLKGANTGSAVEVFNREFSLDYHVEPRDIWDLVIVTTDITEPALSTGGLGGVACWGLPCMIVAFDSTDAVRGRLHHECSEGLEGRAARQRILAEGQRAARDSNM